jgi:hypothetical protein
VILDQGSTARNLWLLAVALGATYWFGAAARSGIGFAFLADLPRALVIAWKCAATGMLVLSTFFAVRGTGLQRMTAVFAMIWLADLILALGQAVVSGVVFACAHVVAASVILKHGRREHDKVAAWALATGVLALALASLVAVWQLGGSLLFAVFPLCSAIATALAARSTLPLALVALGYGIFFLSDAAVVVAMASPGGAKPWGWFSWLTFFGGLALMSRGLAVASGRR